MKLWIKISSENRRMGAWFYELADAKTCARRWEMLIPVEFPDWPNVADDNDHSRSGESADKTFPDLIDEAYRKGIEEGRRQCPYCYKGQHDDHGDCIHCNGTGYKQ